MSVASRNFFFIVGTPAIRGSTNEKNEQAAVESVAWLFSSESSAEQTHSRLRKERKTIDSD